MFAYWVACTMLTLFEEEAPNSEDLDHVQHSADRDVVYAVGHDPRRESRAVTYATVINIHGS